MLPSPGLDVTFRNSSVSRPSDVTLMRNGSVVHSRAKLNKRLSHLIISNVGEGDEGIYSVKNPKNPGDNRTIMLIVRGTCIHDVAVADKLNSHRLIRTFSSKF